MTFEWTFETGNPVPATFDEVDRSRGAVQAGPAVLKINDTGETIFFGTIAMEMFKTNYTWDTAFNQATINLYYDIESTYYLWFSGNGSRDETIIADFVNNTSEEFEGEAFKPFVFANGVSLGLLELMGSPFDYIRTSIAPIQRSSRIV